MTCNVVVDWLVVVELVCNFKKLLVGFGGYKLIFINQMKATNNIEYRWLSGPEFSSTGQTLRLKPGNMYDAHGLEIYWKNIRTYLAMSAEKQQEHNFNMWDWLK